MKKKILLVLITILLVGCSLKTDTIKPEERETKGPSKAALANQVVNYIRAVSLKVNEMRKLQFYDATTLFMVPVGNDSSKSCVTLEGSDSNSWKFLYVAVAFTGNGYDYFAIGETTTGRGFEMTVQEDFKINIEEVIYEASGDSQFKNDLISHYNATTNETRELNETEKEAFDNVISKHNKIKYIAYIAGGPKCSY